MSNLFRSRSLEKICILVACNLTSVIDAEYKKKYIHLKTE